MAQVEATMQDVVAEAEGAAVAAGAAVAMPAAEAAEMPARPADRVTRIAAASAADATPGAGATANESGATTKPRFASITDAKAQELIATRNSGVKPMLNRYGYRFVKRAFDIVASGCAIALLFVPSLVLCAVICIKSPGAGPIYGQTRVGRVKRDGGFSTFRLYKFRSMVPDADERLCALRDKNEADGPLFKIKEDPRVIPGVGRFIRKHSMAWVIIGTPGDGESTKPLSHSAKTSNDLQLCERRPGFASCVRNHYTSPEFLSFGFFGGSASPLFGATAKAVSA